MAVPPPMLRDGAGRAKDDGTAMAMDGDWPALASPMPEPAARAATGMASPAAGSAVDLEAESGVPESQLRAPGVTLPAVGLVLSTATAAGFQG